MSIKLSEEKQKETAQESKSEEEAATKIQAAFRGHKTRKSISMKAANKNDPEPEPTKAELEAEFRADDKGKGDRNFVKSSNKIFFMNCQ
ncbi:hypothetical protein KGM_201220 [Danaus plexippus plexippus]|uniref:Uncharacterized protein n=1 Tax=Danaus plexippus plexippus TaxID=278856 RepID=A0A212F2Z0_DANPL|nr:hypothetical protein KGM_201220 [Danaus plexippus plexippus]